MTFEIDYEICNKNELQNAMLKAFEKDPTFNTYKFFAPVIYSTFSTITIKTEGAVKPNNKIINVQNTNKSIQITDWVWDWCNFFSKNAIIPDTKTAHFVSSDNPLEILIQNSNNTIALTFTGLFCGKTEVEYACFLTNLTTFLKKFTSELIDINPNIKKNTEFKQMLENVKKIEQILTKNQKGTFISHK